MFGRKKKRVDLKNLLKRNTPPFSMEELSITPQMVAEAIAKSDIPQALKDSLLDELPNFVELVDEATSKIFSPSAAWFESLQFADYVAQLAGHLREDHGPDCTKEIAERLVIMAESYKDLAEHAMTIIDKSDARFKHGS
jgi:hypothetical protein